MTTKQYIHKKNDIVLRVTGVILVPADQIVDIPPVLLSTEPISWLDGSICPYCRAFQKEEDCPDCPMYLANNRCSSSSNTPSTWGKADIRWDKLATDTDKAELLALVIDYNKGQ